MHLTVISPPRISKEVFKDVLERAGSDAVKEADELFDLMAGKNIDPAVGLAFFAHESAYGTRGITQKHTTRNWGNLRRPHNPGLCQRIINTSSGQYAVYETWEKGLTDWCDHMVQTYIGHYGLHSVKQVLVRYAPLARGDGPQLYYAHVESLVVQWMIRSGREVEVPDWVKPVDPRFDEAWARSGGDWKKRQLTPGKAVTAPFEFGGRVHQGFERGIARLEEDGTVTWATVEGILNIKASEPS